MALSLEERGKQKRILSLKIDFKHKVSMPPSLNSKTAVMAFMREQFAAMHI